MPTGLLRVLLDKHLPPMIDFKIINQWVLLHNNLARSHQDPTRTSGPAPPTLVLEAAAPLWATWVEESSQMQACK